MKKHLSLLIIFLFALATCTQTGTSDSDSLQIAISVFPISDIARNIAGNYVSVSTLVPAGANPHNYEPTPSKIRDLADIDLFIGVSDHFDEWTADYLPEGTKVYYLTEESDEEETHNPHIWLSLSKAQEIAEKIANTLSEIDPDNAEAYSNNLADYLVSIRELDNEAKTLFDGLENRKFIQWHPAWDYLAEDYGLEIAGTIEEGHGQEPSLREFIAMVENARSLNVSIVVVGFNQGMSSAQTLADEIGAKLLQLDSQGDAEDPERDSYIGLMRWNIYKLYGALADNKE